MSTKLARPIECAIVCVLIFEALGFLLAGVLSMYYALLGMALVLGWVPVLAVAVRRPQSPTRADLCLMCAGFPAIFAAFALVNRYRIEPMTSSAVCPSFQFHAVDALLITAHRYR